MGPLESVNDFSIRSTVTNRNDSRTKGQIRRRVIAIIVALDYHTKL